MGFFDLFSSPQKAVQQQAQNLVNANLYQWLNNGQPVALNDKHSTYLQDGYLGAGAVYECVNLILKKLATCPILIYEVKDSQKLQKYRNLQRSNTIESKAQALHIKAQVLEETSLPEIQDVIDRPNKMQKTSDFIKCLGGYYLLTGNTYVYFNGPEGIKGKITDIHTLPASEIEIISGGMFEPVKEYRMRTGNSMYIPFPKEVIGHLKTFNPEYTSAGSQLYGMSPLRAYLRVLARTKAGNREMNKQLANGGTFGILSPKNKEDQWNKEQSNALKEKMQEAKKSTDEISRIFPGAVPMEWLQIGLPISDMKLMDLMQASDEDIYRCFGIPLQFRSQDASTYNNMQTANEMLIYNAVAPLADEIGDLLTDMICEPIRKRTGKTYLIRLDWSSLPEMSKDMGKIAEWLDKAWDLTPNEKREVKGWGKSPNPAMDQVYIPGTYKLIDDVMMGEADFSKAFDRTEEPQG